MANKTTIRGNNQIKDLSINNNQIANNAGIETSKLAEGQELLKRDGSVPLTGDLDAGGNKIENLAAPVGNNDAARKVDIDTAVSDINSDISTLEGRMDTAESDIDALQAEDIALDGRLDIVEAKDVEQDGRLDSLEAEDIALDGRLDVVEAKDVEQDGRLDVAEADIVALEGRMDTAETDIDALQAEDIALDGRLDVVEAKNVEQDGRLDVAEADIDALQAEDIALDGRLDVVEAKNVEQDGRLDVAEADIDALQAEDIALDGRLDVVEAKNVEQDGRLDVAEADIVALEAADVALDSRLDALELLKDAQMVYVSKNGNDSTGNGGEHSPYLTLQAAMASITDASPTKRYIIKVNAGTYTESGILNLKANVFVVGEYKDAVRIGATSFGLDSSFSGSADNRSGFVSVVLLNACDFNWQTVTSAAGKLYFNDVSFSSTVAMYGHNNAIAQAQFHNCMFFAAFTVSGINVGVHRNNIHYSNINLNQHPNGGMATILVADGGVCSGTVTLTAAVNDFGRRCSLFARSFYMEYLTVDGASTYADLTDNSVPRDIARVTKSNGGNIVYINTLAPIDTNSRNIGDVGRQYLYNFNYVNASTGTDLYVISMGTAYAADSSGKSIFIEADSYGLNADVSGGDINITTAAVSGTGVRGKVKIDARELDLVSKKIINLADGVDSNDAINKGQLDAFGVTIDGDINALEARMTTAEGDIDSLEARMTTAEGDIDTLESGLAQEILDRQAGVQEAKDYTDQKVADLVNGAPAVLDTLKELADALGNDENFATTIAGQIGDLDTRLDTAELDIDGLQTDLAAEEAARIAADDVIDGRLDDLESGVFVSREIPSGLIDGSNTIFTLANTPNSNSEQVFLNGILQNKGSLSDYTISGDTITFVEAPSVGDVILVSYIYNALAVVVGSGSGVSAYAEFACIYSGSDTVIVAQPTVAKVPLNQSVFNEGIVLDTVDSTWTHNATGKYMITLMYRQDSTTWGSDDLWHQYAVKKDGATVVGRSVRASSRNAGPAIVYQFIYDVDSTSAEYSINGWVAFGDTKVGLGPTKFAGQESAFSDSNFLEPGILVNIRKL